MRNGGFDATRRTLVGAALVVGALATLQAAAHDVRPGARAGGVTRGLPADSLRLALEAPDTVTLGEPVPLTFRVENVSAGTLNLYLLGRTIAFDVVARDAAGKVVWRRMAGEIVPQILRVETLEAGDTLTLEATWDQRSDAGQPVPAGTYALVAELFTDGEPLRSPEVRVRVVER